MIGLNSWNVNVQIKDISLHVLYIYNLNFNKKFPTVLRAIDKSSLRKQKSMYLTSQHFTQFQWF